MKAFLMHPDRDFESSAGLGNEEELRQDLELDTLLDAMARGDRFLLDVNKAALMSPMTDPDAIRFRQAVVADCLGRPELIRELYTLALEAVTGARQHWRFFSSSPSSIRSSALSVLEYFVGELHRLRDFADTHQPDFRSDGLRRLCQMLHEELSDEYLAEVAGQLKTMRLERGTLISAALGQGNKGIGHVLRVTPDIGWREWLAQLRRPPHSFDIAPRDQASLNALSDLEARGLNPAANALAQSADHIKSFFTMLLVELAFYVGCLNLYEHLQDLGVASCMPDPVSRGTTALRASELCDVSLALRLSNPVVGNTLNADGKRLVIVTGANQGGKSTFLRSLGQAQLMMQCGMFVAATAFRADVRERLFTHFKREEDTTMESGKLDEELTRMGTIAASLTHNSEVLCNESFASTNEREGSEIARQVTAALTEAGVKVVFVTHLFEFADAVRRQGLDDVLFLRAPRGHDGERTYALVEADPLPTSHGRDTYEAVFDPA